MKETTETQNASDGITVYDSWDEMVQSWTDRSNALQKEMMSYGWSSIFIGMAHDQMDERPIRVMHSNGNFYTIIGLLQYYLQFYLNKCK